jgi:Zn-dependent membrane protease YugP
MEGKAGAADEPGLTLQRGNDHSPLGKSPTHFGVAVRVGGASSMLILGLILLIIGFVAKIAILWTIGIILLIIGAVLWILGSRGRPVGGRRHYW